MNIKRNDDIKIGDWVVYLSNSEDLQIRKVIGAQDDALLLLISSNGNPYTGYKTLYRLATLEEIRRHQLKDLFRKERK
jgi:hypothetical protein